MDSRVIWLLGRVPLMVSYHHGKGGGLRHCSSADIMVLNSHVTLQNHLI